MKPILALLLVLGFLVGMCFLVVSTTRQMHARNELPPEPRQVLTAEAAETLAMYAPPPDPAEEKAEQAERIRWQEATMRARRTPLAQRQARAHRFPSTGRERITSAPGRPDASQP